jgi:hypothetical protein
MTDQIVAPSVRNGQCLPAVASAPTVSDLVDARLRQLSDLGNLRPGMAFGERGTHQIGELLVQDARLGGDFTAAGAVLSDLRQAIHAANICIFNLAHSSRDAVRAAVGSSPLLGAEGRRADIRHRFDGLASVAPGGQAPPVVPSKALGHATGNWQTLPYKCVSFWRCEWGAVDTEGME